MSVHIFDTVRGVQEALRNTDLEQSMYKAGAIIMDDVLLTLHGAAHHKRRTAAFKVFGRAYFRYYEREVFPATLSRTLEPFLARGSADLIDCGYRVTLNLTADFAGIDRPEQSPAETEALLHCVKRFSEAATLFHSRRDHTEVIREAGAALQEFDQRFFAPSRDRRETALARFAAGEMIEEELPRDVLTMLLRSYDELELTPEILRREIAFYMQAGAHSTANSTVHAMHHILDWCDAHPGSREALLADRLLLQRFVHESLRLHPASPAARRMAGCPTRIGTHTEVASGDEVIADIHSANRETSVFGEDAAEFNPYRSTPPGVWPFGLTFGFGMHACMGRDLDGGVVPRPDTRADDHQYGIVMLFVEALLRQGARRDPAHPPVPDANTARPNWGHYPVLLGAP